MSQCHHTFIKKYLTKPVPTHCHYCGEIIWVFEGLVRNCTQCDIFFHEKCFRNVVENAQRCAAQEAETDRRRSINQETVCLPDDELSRAYDIIDKNSVSFISPKQDEEAGHQHQFYEETFLKPTTCDVCNSLLLGLRKQGLACTGCDFTAHQQCVQDMIDSGKAQLLDGEQYAAYKEAQSDPLRGTVLGDTLSMVQRFSARNHRWQLGLLNPLHMNKLFSDHDQTFKLMANAMPQANVTNADINTYISILRYATAVYGQAYEEGYMNSCLGSALMRVTQRRLLAPKDEVNNNAVVDVLGFPRDALSYSQWGSKVLEPSFAILTDHKEKRIVIAFRGSLSDADFLTDACGHTRHFCGGAAHDGMSCVVDELIEKGRIVTETQKLLDANPGFSLVVTGHSLGAGLTLLFTIKATKDKLFGSTIPTAVAFAPPPVVTTPLADEFDENITSIVAATDVVCRLQFNSLDRLGATLAHAADTNEFDLAEETSIAGRVLMITDPHNLGGAGSNRLVAVRRGQAVLHQIFMSSDMVSNHLMGTYATGLKNSLVHTVQ